MLAVKLYKDDPNVFKLPKEWPAETYPIESAKDAVAPFIAMTNQEYESYKEAHKSKYEAWKQEEKASELEKKTANKLTKKQKKDAVLIKLGITEQEFADLLSKDMENV